MKSISVAPPQSFLQSSQQCKRTNDDQRARMIHALLGDFLMCFVVDALFLTEAPISLVSSSNTATCAMAALSVPMPSGVFALIPT